MEVALYRWPHAHFNPGSSKICQYKQTSHVFAELEVLISFPDLAKQ